MKQAVGKAMYVSDDEIENMNFYNVTKYCDAYESRKFHGLKTGYTLN